MRTGALTLLITVVLVCMAVLAVLAFSTARADLALADKAMARFQLDAACENEAQQWLAQVDEALAAGRPLPGGLQPDEDGVVEAVIPGGEGRRVSVRLQLTPDGPGRWRVQRWQLGQDWQADDSLELWDGTF